VRVGDLKVGLMHGHQIVPWGDPEALAMVARQLDVDLMVTGHTHKFEAFEYEGRFFINPGSVTGSYSGIQAEVTPSFALLDVQGSSITTYVYQLIDGEVKVEKMEFSKA
jgi:vacuolar protein sorting-associated protein 29